MVVECDGKGRPVEPPGPHSASGSTNHFCSKTIRHPSPACAKMCNAAHLAADVLALGQVWHAESTLQYNCGSLMDLLRIASRKLGVPGKGCDDSAWVA